MIDLISPISAVTATVVILLTATYLFIRNRDVVPGPLGLPYFGLYPYLTDEKCHLQLEEIGKKYGDIYSFTLLGRLFVNLGSAKALREVHINKSDCFSGRPEAFSMLTYSLQEGVAMVNGEAWKYLKKFFVQSFKEYGLTAVKDNTAGPLYDSVAGMIKDFRGRRGQPFKITNILTKRCTVTMQKVLFGDCEDLDAQLEKMLQAYTVALEGMSGIKMVLFGPFARFLFLVVPSLRKSLTEHQFMKKLLVEITQKIESSFDGNYATCVVEAFCKERNLRKLKNDPSWRYFSDTALASSLSQIVGDGILAVAYFIRCFLYALVKHPEEQEKIYREIMDVVGPSRLPTIEDKGNLPYTNAFINEVIRTSNFFALFPSMECTKETTVRGYRIPKGAITLLNMWQAHHDPTVYQNPYKFDPTRFMSIAEKPRAELPVQFGIGKRACFGEPYAMNQVFLFVTSVIKHFTISEPDTTSKKSELFLMTGDMELCVHPRDEQ